MLNEKQIAQYHQQGFLVLEQLIADDICAKLIAQAQRLINQSADLDPANTFSTENNNRSDDLYFLDSAERIRCFYEPEAFDQQGQLQQDKLLSINKIGHALHQLDPLFKQFSQQRLFGDIATAIGISQPQIRQSMMIFKQPKIGGEVHWHQDASFFYTTPHSVTTFWFALEEATLTNGCLWVEPGGHKKPLRERFNRHGNTTEMVKLDPTPWPDQGSGESVPVKAGSLVLFHGFLPHYSAANRSNRSRLAYTLHITDGKSQYAAENWLQANQLPLMGFEGHR